MAWVAVPVPEAAGFDEWLGRERSGILGHVDRVPLEHIPRDDFQRSFMGGSEDDERGRPGGVRAQPVASRDAPAVPGTQTREAVQWQRRGEVIADAALVVEELGGDHGADRVAAAVLGARTTATVAVEAGERIMATSL